MKFIKRLTTAAIFACLAPITPAFSQPVQVADPLQYADIADLAGNSPVVIHAVVKEDIKVKPERATGLQQGFERHYIVAETRALIRGSGGAPKLIRYVIDMPLGTNGKTAKLKRSPVILFARQVNAVTGDTQLSAPDAQISWTPERDARVRSIVREFVGNDAAPDISRITSAFHVPGTIIGEGETQVFMETKTGDPISITVISRDQKKNWAVSLSEIVDQAANAPTRNSLLWYRLACFLPKNLPISVIAADREADANQAKQDYATVMQELGTCPRARPANMRQP